MDDESPEARAAYFHRVAGKLRAIAERIQFDTRRKGQILALAAGFERFAQRFEQAKADDPDKH